MSAGVVLYSPVHGCEEADIRFSTAHIPVFLGVADSPNVDFVARCDTPPDRSFPVHMREKFWNSSPANDKAFSIHFIPFYFRDFIKKFDPINY